ncbi:expressed unknown protein [Seminavis robusta]|uniref:DUF7467 domain-containing protein n=1 Tax=Seminavis robusta TaxID=568900 RepID=A0A9N8DT43_9STRA|nr:expressed unknown protein [Seminavis robusta]|eukprot:Sro332_g119240.1 n/a (512) ;mRNA; f:16705-18316
MVFLFNGGDCSQSFNVQEAAGKFFCTDEGEVPIERGEKSYIVVTDLDGDIIFHQDWVEVGKLFTLSDGGNNFPADQLITIYGSEDTTDPANIQQSIQYHSSCSQNLFLKDRFGAVQLVIWVNEDQGVVSCFANQTFNLDITIPLDIEGGPATLQSLTVASNVDPFFFNLTDKVAGTVVGAGESIVVPISIPIDLTQKQTYNLLITVTAVTQLGRICRATDLTSFTAGYPLPPIFPTFAPTQAPTSTNPPTPDPLTSACDLAADIECFTGSGRSCRSLTAPTDSVCNTADEEAQSITFLVTGNSCGTTENCEETFAGQDLQESEFFINAESRDATAFQGVVANGGTFRVMNGLEDGRLEISISTAVNGAPGLQLQVLDRVDVTCAGNVGEDITLLQNFGALQVVSYESPDQGLQSIYDQITITYVVKNDGVLSATAQSAVKTSAFEATEDLLASGAQVMAPNTQLSFPSSSVEINLAENSGSEFAFSLDVSGVGTTSGTACSDSAALAIRIS